MKSPEEQEKEKQDKKQQSQFDRMTKTPVSKLILTLSVPTIITMLVTNIYNLVDTAFVGQLGTSASGAVGVVFGLMAILQAIGFMFGQGSGSIIARYLGHKKIQEASRTASTGFFCSLAFGVICAAVCFLLLDPLVRLLGSTETIAPFAKTYISYILIAAPFTISSFVMNNILRYEGRAMLGMIGMITGAILNIAGDQIFMFVLGMGIAGAGLSTALSQFISFCILLSMFLFGKTTVKLKLTLVSLKPAHLANIAATGLPSLLRQGLNSVVTIILNSCAGVYGDAAIAAMSIVSRIIFFVFSIGLGVGQGFQPVSGFNYGAERYDRVRSAFRFMLILAECVIVAGALVVFLFSGSLIGLFRDDPEVIEIGTRALKLQCVSLLFLPICMAAEMLYQSTGHKLGASVLSSLRSGLLFIPILLILSQVRGLPGIQEAQPLANTLAAFPAILLIRRFFQKYLAISS